MNTQSPRVHPETLSLETKFEIMKNITYFKNTFYLNFISLHKHSRKNVIFIFGTQTLRNYFSVHRHSGKNRNLYIRLADIVESNHTEISKPQETNPLPACLPRLISFKQLAFYYLIATKLEQ
jgi:hypothetical protein